MWTQTKGIFDALGFDVDPIPCVWHKTTGSVVWSWDFRFANYWEPILFISNRTSFFDASTLNDQTFSPYPSVPNNLRANVAEKPVELIRETVTTVYK